MTNAAVLNNYNFNQVNRHDNTADAEGIGAKMKKIMKAVLVCEDHNPYGLTPQMKARLYL